MHHSLMHIQDIYRFHGRNNSTRKNAYYIDTDLEICRDSVFYEEYLVAPLALANRFTTHDELSICGADNII